MSNADAQGTYVILNQTYRELLPLVRPDWPRRYWLLFLINPAMVAFIYLAYAMDWQWALSKYYQEQLAAYLLMPLVVLGWGAGLAIRRTALHGIVLILATTMLCREIHFVGTHKGIYVAAVVIAVWAFLWRKRLAQPLNRGRIKPLLLATIFAYAVSIILSRRVFRGVLPLENELHISMEEFMENAAHTLFFITALVALLTGSGSRDGGAGDHHLN